MEHNQSIAASKSAHAGAKGVAALTADVEPDDGDGGDGKERSSRVEHGKAQDEGQGAHEEDCIDGRLGQRVDSAPQLPAWHRTITGERPQHPAGTAELLRRLGET